MLWGACMRLLAQHGVVARLLVLYSMHRPAPSRHPTCRPHLTAMASSDDEVHHGSYLGDSQWEDDQPQEDVRDRVVKQAAVIRDMRAATKVRRGGSAN